MKIPQRILDKKFMQLAFDRAYEHLGSTKENPSVGCVVVKNNTIISSGKTSLNGRPHAETNALNKKKNFNNSTIYVTLEPCAHHGLTPPCVSIIKKNNIKKVYYSIPDPDKRTFNKAKDFLKKFNIKVNIGIMKNDSLNFYKSYILSKDKKKLPYTDVKIAISRDYFSVNKKGKWITNRYSRLQGHLLRSRYDCIISTYKTVNEDNSILNCRINGMHHLSPNRVIVDKDFKLNKNLKLFKTSKTIPTFVITASNNKKKENFLKSKKVKIIKLDAENNSLPYEKILRELKKRGFSRILCESGANTCSELLKFKLVNNLYVFMSQTKLGKNGKNSFKRQIKDLKMNKKNRIKINLFGDEFYKVKVK